MCHEQIQVRSYAHCVGVKGGPFFYLLGCFLLPMPPGPPLSMLVHGLAFVTGRSNDAPHCLCPFELAEGRRVASMQELAQCNHNVVCKHFLVFKLSSVFRTSLIEAQVICLCAYNFHVICLYANKCPFRETIMFLVLAFFFLFKLRCLHVCVCVRLASRRH